MPGFRKDRQMQFRVTEDEGQRVDQWAKGQGLSVSEYVRMRVLREDPIEDRLARIEKRLLAIEKALAERWIREGS